MEPSALGALAAALEAAGASARAYHKALRVSRTIADLQGSELVHRTHVAEALDYRLFDRDEPRTASGRSLITAPHGGGRTA